MKKNKKIIMLLSAMTVLTVGASFNSFASNGWQEENGTWVYLDKDGDRVYDTWKKSSNQYFYLDENGEMAIEKLIETDGEIYYADANGAKTVNSWVSVDNEDGDEINGEEVDTLWYYFGSNGKAVRATTGNVKIKEIPHSGAKLKYLFDTEGRMLSGWQTDDSGNLYYLGDENTGAAAVGWMLLDTDDENFSEEYDDLKWFYFDNGKAVKDKSKFLKGAWYTFDENGVMEDGWFGASTPPAAASGAEAYASESGTLGNGWIYTTAPDDEDGDESWYYLVTIREGNDVSRSIPFNYAGDNVQAKSIKSKTYLFDNEGQMQTGVMNLGEVEANEKGSKALAAGIYFFNDESGSKEGQMATGKTTVKDEGETYYYHFQTTGQAYVNALKDGTLYGSDGKRIQAEDGSSYMLYTLGADITVVGKDKVIESGTTVVVNRSGKVKTSGTARVDDETYEINKDSYHASLKTK